MLQSTMMTGAVAALGFLPSASAAAIRRQAPSGVPSFVTKYAPIVYLFSGENFNPASMQAQLDNTTTEDNFVDVDGAPSPLTLDNLDQLNDMGDTDVYLTSNDDITTFPDWLHGQEPDANGKVDDVSNVVIVTDHGDGTTDAFYMFFYAYDWGGEVLGQNVGNHVGDWEHMMVRFNNGTHANYAITGTHDHTIPDINLPHGLIEDHTDKGAMFDSVSNTWFYSFNPSDSSFSAYDDSTPVAFLNYDGQWGDEEYPDSDDRQSSFFGVPKYGSGPNGPQFKDLNRTEVCPDNGILCIVSPILRP